MALTGNMRVRMTRWSQKLVLQTEHTRQSGVIVSWALDGSQSQRPNIEFWWEDATIEDLQELGGTAKIGAPTKLTVAK